MRTKMRPLYFGLVVTVTVAWASMSPAQLAVDNGSPDQAELIREVAPQPPTFAINSAIVLTNPYERPSDFKIELYDNNGNVAGGGSVTVAPRALEVVWVSNLLNEDRERFVGWGVAKSDRPLQCNAYLAGIGVTPLPVENQRVRRSTDARSRRKLFSLLAALP